MELALSLDIPFWPQLPHLSYYEDMYVQAAEHFPGILLFPEENRIRFDTAEIYGGPARTPGHLGRTGLF